MANEEDAAAAAATVAAASANRMQPLVVAAMPPLDIDGSYGEGGGQVLRNTIAYAAITRRPICVNNIRAGRPNPGLAAQHLAGIRAVHALTGGSLQKAEVRSTSVEYDPGSPSADTETGPLVADCGTAGACTLIIQTVLPVLALGRTRRVFSCRGGTDAPFAPPYSYLRDVTLPTLSLFGLVVELEVVNRGLMPRGGSSAPYHAAWATMTRGGWLYHAAWDAIATRATMTRGPSAPSRDWACAHRPNQIRMARANRFPLDHPRGCAP
jgi:RNA 3'-phosphate cyclase